jgi:hypothetical protein
MTLNFKDVLRTELQKVTEKKPIVNQNCKIDFVTREQFMSQRNIKIKESL